MLACGQMTSDRDLRRQIVEVATELGSKTGEAGLTMRALAARIGVSATALYQHFDSKASILAEIRLDAFQRLIAACRPALAQADARSFVRDVSARYVTFACSEPFLYGVLTTRPARDALAPEQLERYVATASDYKAAMWERLPGLTEEQDRNGLLTDWWCQLHGLVTLLLSRTIGAHDPLMPVSNLQGFVDGYVERVTDSVLARAKVDGATPAPAVPEAAIAG